MSLRKGIAKATAGTLTWGLKHIARRPAGNLPGKVGLKIDPALISELRWKFREGSIVVVGTNGKTTVTNLLADTIEASGKSVLCNRTGANLKSGIASAMLQGKPSDWGVIECDELWMAKVLPDLRPTYVLLLNLFRDQLDRCGEIDRIQDAIVSALESSPETQLIYNADDPLCEFIAERVADSNCARTLAFGITESLGLAQNNVSDATMCQQCSHMFTYEYRQYGQLGLYSCPNCGFHRPELNFFANDIEFSPQGLKLRVNDTKTQENCLVHASLVGSYMAYNILAIYCASRLTGTADADIQRAIDSFDPHNGRLQRYSINGRKVLLNLAKNPTGFNQNLRIVSSDTGAKGVAFFINDEVVDGHDISWIWDIDFEELASHEDTYIFAGGKRRNDLQVRLKYAGIKAELIEGVGDTFEMMGHSKLSADAPLYAIANYSALPPVKRTLDSMEKAKSAKSVYGATSSGYAEDEGADGTDSDGGIGIKNVNDIEADVPKQSKKSSHGQSSCTSPIVITHILPDLLNLYGDGGNVKILEKRLQWRDIPVEVRKIEYGQPIKFDDVDLVFLGGGPDREQKLATEELFKVKPEFVKYLQELGPMLAICGGYQILGRTWLLGDEEVEGLGVLNMETRRPGTSADRLVDNVALESKAAKLPVIGYENHAGRTYLDEELSPFGRVISRTGSGNADDLEGKPLSDGVLVNNIIGTYLHGTLLSKNPEVADWLLGKAIERHAKRTGDDAIELEALDDSEETAANAFMAKKII